MAGMIAIPLYNLYGCSPTGVGLPEIGLQMYTVRNEAEKDYAGTVKRVSGMGFKGVESAFLPEGIGIRESGKIYADNGLKVFAAHVELPVDPASRDEMLEIADAYGCDRMIWHGWPEDQRYRSIAGTDELIALYNQAGEFAQSNGLSFGIHNHWWEYEIQDSGRYPYEMLLNGLDRKIFFEIDTYWVTVAGHDPASIIRRFGKRAPLIHIKDGPARYTDSLDSDDPDPMVPLGKGAMDIPSIAEAGKNTLEWIIVELDVVESDVYQAIEQSYDYLVSNKFAAGLKNPEPGK